MSNFYILQVRVSPTVRAALEEIADRRAVHEPLTPRPAMSAVARDILLEGVRSNLKTLPAVPRHAAGPAGRES